MFSVEFLHELRRHELEMVVRQLPPGARILELGAGTGFQARELARRGHAVLAIDLEGSAYRAARVHPVLAYDGRNFPCENRSIDVVFSSNVLEHIRDLAPIHAEARRVLKTDGYCLHALPTPCWRLWTSLAGFPEGALRLVAGLPELLPRRADHAEFSRAGRAGLTLARTVAAHILPLPHGETGNALTELLSFSARRWRRHFQAQGWEVESVTPMGLFYTGHMLLGPRWPVTGRARAARLIGSACALYRLRPRGET